MLAVAVAVHEIQPLGQAVQVVAVQGLLLLERQVQLTQAVAVAAVYQVGQ
jgi:hypothetical protein